jgi:hypothetical protein
MSYQPPLSLRRIGTMNHLCNLLTAVGVGAGLAYFFDPVAGRRRRALLRDKVVRTARVTSERADARMRDIRNRAYGTYHELSKDAHDVVEAASGAARRLGRTVRELKDTSGQNT